MDSKPKDNIKKFRFIKKRKLSVHYSIAHNFNIKAEQLSNENSPTRNKKKKKTLSQQEESVKRIREIYMNNKKGFVYNKQYDLSKYEEPELDFNSVKRYILGSYNDEFKKILHILTSDYSERSEEELNSLLSFLIKIRINETLKTDMLLTELTIPELYQYFKPYIFGKYYNFMDAVFYNGEEAENLYVVLHGSLGQYRLEIYEEELTCEEYYIFLSDCYNLYEEESELGYILTEEEEPKKGYNTNFKSFLQSKKINNLNIKNNNKNIDSQKKHNNFDDSDDEYNEEDKKEQYIDHYLICQMIDENKDIYPLLDIADLVRLKKIIFKLRLHNVLNELKPRDAELLYLTYDYPTSYLNFDKVLDGIIPVSKYVEILSYNFKKYDYFYMKFLGPLKHKVKLMKYVKCSKNLEPYSIFGNYELINTLAKRNLTVRCESEDCILLCINKRMYGLAVYNAQKKQRDKELELMHSFYLFKNTSKKYFNRRIYSNFQISNLFKDNLLFKQNQKMNAIIFIKEGIIELSLQNVSFIDFHKLIKQTKEIIIKKGKELRMNMKEFFDFETNVESKTFYNMTTLKGILNQKQNFIFQRNEKGIFGDYELFFDIPALLTGTVLSDRCILYYYGYDKYKSLSEETYLLNDSLRYNCFIKIKSLLKRMIMVYNSYWRLSIEQLDKNIKEKEKILNILNDEEKDSQKKSVFNSTNLINSPFLDNIYSYKSNDKIINLVNKSPVNGRFNLLYKGMDNKQNFLSTTNNMYNNNFLINNKFKENNNNLNNNKEGSISFKLKNNISESNSHLKLNNKNYSNTPLNLKDNLNKRGFSNSKIIINDSGKENNIELKTIIYNQRVI